MLTQIRNSVFSKILWGFIGVFLLNISVDSVDPNPNYIPENLSINDQESIVEIVVEKVLGYEDAFEEYDDNDTEDHNKKTNVKIDLTTHYIKEEPLKKQFLETAGQKFPDYTALLTKGFQKLAIPPPEV